MVDANQLAVCVVLGLASCGPRPRAAPLPPASAEAAPTAVRARPTAPAADPDAWSVKGWSWSGGSGVMFVDRGAELLVTNGSALTLVDPRRRIVINARSRPVLKGALACILSKIGTRTPPTVATG